MSASKQALGAKLVGGRECAICHAELVGKFASSTHAKFVVSGAEGTAVGCETCHGPGSAHVKAGGGKGLIVNPAKNPDTCFQCHLDKRGQFSLPNSHPVLAGKVTCRDCHDLHDHNAIKGKGGSTLEADNETCTKCHTAQKGPFVFTHNAMREGCTACHNPHGSVNAKMLLARDANLCLKCHLERPLAAGNRTIVAGGEDHRTRMQNGTCWSAGCHEAVHGSNSSKPLRY
ncbi:MAG: cytochrome c3 family protein [Opitutaceae bacterium]